MPPQPRLSDVNSIAVPARVSPATVMVEPPLARMSNSKTDSSLVGSGGKPDTSAADAPSDPRLRRGGGKPGTKPLLPFEEMMHVDVHDSAEEGEIRDTPMSPPKVKKSFTGQNREDFSSQKEYEKTPWSIKLRKWTDLLEAPKDPRQPRASIWDKLGPQAHPEAGDAKIVTADTPGNGRKKNNNKPTAAPPLPKGRPGSSYQFKKIADLKGVGEHEGEDLGSAYENGLILVRGVNPNTFPTNWDKNPKTAKRRRSAARASVRAAGGNPYYWGRPGHPDSQEVFDYEGCRGTYGHGYYEDEDDDYYEQPQQRQRTR